MFGFSLTILSKDTADKRFSYSLVVKDTKSINKGFCEKTVPV